MTTRSNTEAVPSFGAELRRWREHRGLSLRQLAEQVCYTFSYLAKLETGSKPPVREVAEACDRVLNTDRELVELALRQSRQVSVGARLTRPAELPPAVADFVGRRSTLEQLDITLAEPGQAGSARVAVVEGAPGAGKTSVVLCWGHTVTERFGDGQLFANLHGYEQDIAPAEPGDILEELLRAMGVPSAAVPVGVEQRSGLLRSVLEGKNVLLVLDNAADSEQVLPLLPHSPGCMVLITTRNRLPGLAMRTGARRVCLQTLDAADSESLLRRILGDERIDAEPRAAERLARRCGHLPLALRVAAEQVALHPYHAIVELTGALATEADSLVSWSVPGDMPSMRAVFSWSYRDLPADIARVFRLLGLHRGTELDVGAAAALAGCSPVQARRSLEHLAGAHLVEEIGKDRYRLHDLLQVYAAECARAEETDDERSRAVGRLLQWYLHSAAAANTVLAPHRGLPELPEPAEAVEAARFGPDDYEAALGWCQREATNLVAAAQQARDHGLMRLSWTLAVVNWNYYFLRKHWNVWIAAHKAGLEAARAAEDRLGEAWCLHNLGMPYSELRRFDEALECLCEAVRLRRELDDQWGLGWSLLALGNTYLEMSRFEEARRQFAEALTVFRGIDFTYGVATVLSWLGTTDCRLDRLEEALRALDQALELFTSLGAADGQGFALVRLGATHRQRREPSTALDYLDRALTLRRDIDDSWGQAEVLLERGHALYGQGDTEGARHAWQQARTLFDELSDPRAADARAHLATLDDEL